MAGTTALLIRPHDFLIDLVREWMVELDLRPVAFESLDDFARHQVSDVRCLVISSAATSRVPATFRQAVDAARRFAPRVPLIFPSLSTLDRVSVGLTLELKGTGLRVESPEATVAWGAHDLALHVSAAWLTPGKRAELNRVARAHLGLAP